MTEPQPGDTLRYVVVKPDAFGPDAVDVLGEVKTLIVNEGSMVTTTHNVPFTQPHWSPAYREALLQLVEAADALLEEAGAMSGQIHSTRCSVGDGPEHDCDPQEIAAYTVARARVEETKP